MGKIRANRGRQGFTLAELLTTLSIIGILSALSMNAVVKAREAANRIVCQHNLRQLALAVHTFHESKRALPPYMTADVGGVHGGWFTHVLPFVGEETLYQEISSHDEPMKDVIAPAIYAPSIRNRRFEILRCPSDPSDAGSFGTTNYLANWYAFTKGDRGAYSKPRRLGEFEDGPSNVVLFAEAYARCQRTLRHTFQPPRYHNFGITAEGKPSDDPVYAPQEYAAFQVRPDSCDAWRTQTGHAAMQIALADGSVRIISTSISAEVWLQILKPGDGDPYEGDW